jgi:hypothetical protein
MSRYALCLALPLAACPAPGDPLPNTGGGHLTWTYQDEVFRAAAEEGAEIENVSELLGPAPRDRLLTPSPNGAWMVMSSERFDCSGECLVRVSWDLSEGEAVKAGGADVYVNGISAITDDGNTIVFSSSGGTHDVDLWATTRGEDGAWSAPLELTAGSSYAYNNMPALTQDGAGVTFDCGSEPYPESGGNDACSVNLDGSGWTRLIGPDALADARNSYVQNPHEGPAGLLFESSWPIDGQNPETIWLLPTGEGTPVPFGSRYENAVSPCGLPDGRVAMLWLGGNDDGYHELVVSEADGSASFAITPGVDVDDIGIGCSE